MGVAACVGGAGEFEVEELLEFRGGAIDENADVFVVAGFGPAADAVGDDALFADGVDAVDDEVPVFDVAALVADAFEHHYGDFAVH